MMDDGIDFTLIDVREQYEYDEANMGGLLIPLGSVIERHNEIPMDKPVVIHCRSGARSATAIRELESRFGYTNLSNLKGGIMAWHQQLN
jgi:rhodanese-related sulfurtransferase